MQEAVLPPMGGVPRTGNRHRPVTGCIHPVRGVRKGTVTGFLFMFCIRSPTGTGNTGVAVANARRAGNSLNKP